MATNDRVPCSIAQPHIVADLYWRRHHHVATMMKDAFADASVLHEVVVRLTNYASGIRTAIALRELR
ncbi:hypothetical protein SB861_61010, partial [Paraburkholderia sp. SIMBA_049]